MPQTSYGYDPKAAIAGQIVEKGRSRGRYENSEDLPAGRLAGYFSTDGKLRLPQGTTLEPIVGAVPYRADLPPGGYLAGQHKVLAMRTGQIWLEYAGTAPSPENSVNVMHSSTTATNRGKVTASATSATAGSEISAVEGLRCVKVDVANGLCLVEMNLPA